MSNLTKTAFFTKKFLTGLFIILVLVIAYFSLRTIAKSIFTSAFPSAGDPPLVAFGKLPQLQFSRGIKPPKEVTYKIETVSGHLVEVAKQLKVFTIKEPIAAFGDLTKANNIAQSIRFTVPPAAVENGEAIYLDRSLISKTLTIELITGNLSLTSNYLNNQAVITSSPKNELGSKSIADAFLSNLKFPVNDFGDVQFTKYKVDNGRLTEVSSLSNANLIQISYNRADIDKVPIMALGQNESRVRVLVTATDVVLANVAVSGIEKYKFSTYPLKGVKKAFEDLSTGYAIYNKDIVGSIFTIRNVDLAYLETDEFVPFLQPVYVFESDDGLEAYVRAISDEFITL